MADAARRPDVPAAAPGWRLTIHDRLASTSDLCRTLAARGEADGLAVMARMQTAGRGSQGRGWVSPPGNLYLSALLRPASPAHEAGQWALLAGVALAEAVAALLPGAALALKWPNDLLLGDAKLAGILIDSSVTASRLDWLVIGIGVNLVSAPVIAGYRATCIAAHGAAPAPEALAADVLARLSAWRACRRRDGFAPVRVAWQRWGARRPGFTGLSAAGALLPAGGG